MFAHRDFLQFETALSYCFTKTRGDNYDQAMHYGRLSGFFDDANKLARLEAAWQCFYSMIAKPRNCLNARILWVARHPSAPIVVSYPNTSSDWIASQ